jgi:uncharacterized protein
VRRARCSPRVRVASHATRRKPAAAKRFERACNDGDAIACCHLGEAYSAGSGVEKDEARAFAVLQKACAGGYEEGCASAGKMLEEGRGTSKDVAKALDLLKRACDGGNATSCVHVAEAYDGGASKNPLLAKMLYQRACVRGEPQGCIGQGRLELGQGGSADSAKRAFEWACNRNAALGCAATKVLFGGQRPVVPHPAETSQLQRSCTAGSARDCAAYGTLMLASGNKGLATPSLERGCMQGDPLACAVKAKK